MITNNTTENNKINFNRPEMNDGIKKYIFDEIYIKLNDKSIIIINKNYFHGNSIILNKGII